MDGQDPKNNRPRRHGLRLVKGYSLAERNTDVNSQPVDSQRQNIGKTNPLILQLNALANAIDNDVKMILDL